MLAAAVHTHAGCRAAALTVVAAASGITMDVHGLVPAGTIHVHHSTFAFFQIRRTAGLVADAGVGAGHMDGRQGAAAGLIMGTGSYFTFQSRHVQSVLSETRSRWPWEDRDLPVTVCPLLMILIPAMSYFGHFPNIYKTHRRYCI